MCLGILLDSIEMQMKKIRVVLKYPTTAIEYKFRF